MRDGWYWAMVLRPEWEAIQISDGNVYVAGLSPPQSKEMLKIGPQIWEPETMRRCEAFIANCDKPGFDVEGEREACLKMIHQENK